MHVRNDESPIQAADAAVARLKAIAIDATIDFNFDPPAKIHRKNYRFNAVTKSCHSATNAFFVRLTGGLLRTRAAAFAGIANSKELQRYVEHFLGAKMGKTINWATAFLVFVSAQTTQADWLNSIVRGTTKGVTQGLTRDAGRDAATDANSEVNRKAQEVLQSSVLKAIEIQKSNGITGLRIAVTSCYERLSTGDSTPCMYMDAAGVYMDAEAAKAMGFPRDDYFSDNLLLERVSREFSTVGVDEKSEFFQRYIEILRTRVPILVEAFWAR